ncbi:hypothetical protein EJB05_37793, partial [Eragrostis curvula]
SCLRPVEELNTHLLAFSRRISKFQGKGKERKDGRRRAVASVCGHGDRGELQHRRRPGRDGPRLKGLRVHLTHVDAHGNYSRLQLLQRAARRSRHRMSRLGYRALKKAFVAQMSLPTADGSEIGLDLCFKAPAKGVDQVEVPKLKDYDSDGSQLLTHKKSRKRSNK